MAMGTLLGVFTSPAHPAASIPAPQLRRTPLLQELTLPPRHGPSERPHPKSNCPVAPRRAALILLFLPVTTFFAVPRRADAFSFSITGPKDWLREQKKKAARFVLAPIDASRQSLRNAYLVLEDLKSPAGDTGELRKLLNAAARDCVPRDRNYFVTFQASTGVEVCTFRLIVKNAASLLDVEDPLKLEADARLDNLIRSFSFLGGAIDSCDLTKTSDREKVKLYLTQSISALDNFELGVKDCLGV